MDRNQDSWAVFWCALLNPLVVVVWRDRFEVEPSHEPSEMFSLPDEFQSDRIRDGGSSVRVRAGGPLSATAARRPRRSADHDDGRVGLIHNSTSPPASRPTSQSPGGSAPLFPSNPVKHFKTLAVR